MNQALILVLEPPAEGEEDPKLLMNGGGLDLRNPNHQRQALGMLRQAQEFLMDALLKPPCPGCEDDE